jgi:hypothetical protein
VVKAEAVPEETAAAAVEAAAAAEEDVKKNYEKKITEHIISPCYRIFIYRLLYYTLDAGYRL